eukprot:m.61994 g.61994  ORF g.61994 m.61994 type:complete len:111 (-) comp11891_c0_seq2:35-367(-)
MLGISNNTRAMTCLQAKPQADCDKYVHTYACLAEATNKDVTHTQHIINFSTRTLSSNGYASGTMTHKQFQSNGSRIKCVRRCVFAGLGIGGEACASTYPTHPKHERTTCT